MSKGLGRLQRLALDVLSRSEQGYESSQGITGAILGRPVSRDGSSPVTPAETSAVRRALQGLASQRLIIDMGRGFCFNRRMWGTLDGARRWLESPFIRGNPRAPIVRERLVIAEAHAKRQKKARQKNAKASARGR